MSGPQVPVGAFVAGANAEPLGHVAAVYVDNATGRLAWAAVRGRRHTAVVPLERSRYDGETLHIPFDSEQLRTAPIHDPAMLISYAEGDDLARHYRLIPDAPTSGTASVNEPAAVDEAAVEEATPVDEAAGSTVRSAEQLRAGAVNVVVGRARLVTYIVTENQTFTLPVRRQEARLVYDALPDQEQGLTDAAPADHVHEVVLHTEQVLFSTQIVPVERVRMVRRVVTSEQTVIASLAAEHIDIEHIAGEHGEHTSSGQVDTGRHPTHEEN